MIGYRVDLGNYSVGDLIYHHGKDYIKERYYPEESRALAEELLEIHRPPFRAKRVGSIFSFKYIEDAINFFWHEPNNRLYKVKCANSFIGDYTLVNNLYGVRDVFYSKKSQNKYINEYKKELISLVKFYWKGGLLDLNNSVEFLSSSPIVVEDKINLTEDDRINLFLMSNEVDTIIPDEDFINVLSKLILLNVKFRIHPYNKISISHKY